METYRGFQKINMKSAAMQSDIAAIKVAQVTKESRTIVAANEDLTIKGDRLGLRKRIRAIEDSDPSESRKADSRVSCSGSCHRRTQSHRRWFKRHDCSLTTR